MRDKISKIIQEIDEIAFREFPEKSKGVTAYNLLEGLHELTDEMDKGSETVKHLKKLDKETVKILRLLWHIGKENYHDPEYNFEEYESDKEKIVRLRDVFRHLLGDSKDIDICVIAYKRIGEYMRKGFAVVFK